MSITKIKASNITDGSITASKLANTYALSTDSISAGTYANTAIANASSASLYANTGISNAASASAYANTGVNNATSASLYANTGINNAASASLYANTKVSKSGDTITGPVIISDTGSGALQVAGTVTISQDLNVTGNIFLSGTATTISSNNLTLSDPLVYLAVGNVANTADMGIVGHVTNGHYYHTGLVRDHLDGTWKFFSNVSSEPTTTINFGEANTVYDVIRVGGVVSPSALINGRELGAYTQASFDKANTAVTSVAGTGTVSGLTLTGTVTSTGSLTLGGTLSLGSLNTLGTAAGLSTNTSYLSDRGSVSYLSVDTALSNGFYKQDNVSDTQGLLVFNPGGSLGPLQMSFTSGGLFQFRNKTDSTTWTPWKTAHSSTTTGIPVAVYNASDAGHYFTDNPTGFTFLEVTFTPQRTSNKFMIIATVNGAAGDDSSGVVERYTNGVWSAPDSLRGSTADASGYQGSFGDWSIVRLVENKQTVQYTATFIDQPGTSGVVGYRVRVSAENVTGAYFNRPIGTDGGYNTNSSRSTMIIMEITA